MVNWAFFYLKKKPGKFLTGAFWVVVSKRQGFLINGMVNWNFQRGAKG